MDSELNREMAGFEAARIKHPVHLVPTAIEKVLAVHDGSDQDATVTQLADATAGLTGAEITTWQSEASEPSAEILAAGAGCDILFVPCPYRADYDTVGRDSLSTTLDLVLARGNRPTCFVRGPVAHAAQCISRPLVVLDIDRHHRDDATSLALSLSMQGDGWLALLTVIDPAVGVAKEELLGRYLDPNNLSPTALGGLATARTAALSAALQRHANEWGIEPRLKFRIGNIVEETLQVNAARGGLIVAGIARGHREPSAHLARALVLGSPYPVLLV